MLKLAMSYDPIHCSDYDLLEQLAFRKIKCIIVYRSGDLLTQCSDTIQDLYVKDKVEWCRLENGVEIRLDHICSINGREIATNCNSVKGFGEG